MDDVAKKQQLFTPIYSKEALIANEYPNTTSQIKDRLLSD